MSRVSSREIDLHCSYDCEITGCPGHKLKLVRCLSSDTVAILWDNKPMIHLDINLLQSICNLYKEMP